MKFFANCDVKAIERLKGNNGLAIKEILMKNSGYEYKQAMRVKICLEDLYG